MDPTENMKRQIALAEELVRLADLPHPKNTTEGDRRVSARLRAGDELAELVIALDEWRRSGGFDPYQDPHKVLIDGAAAGAALAKAALHDAAETDTRARRDLIGGSLVETTRGTATLLAYIAEPSSPTGRTLLVRLVDGGEEFETTIDDLLTRDRRTIT